MHLQLQQESLLIGRRPAGFTEHYYTEWDDGLGKEKISLFLVMSIASSQVPGAELGKEAFQLLQDHFLDDLSGDPYDRFESALREINNMVNEKERDLELKFIPNMNVICGVIQKDMVFLSQRGESQGYLVRKRHVSSITEGLYDEKNKEDLFQNIASGILEVGDSVVLTTGHLVQYVTPNDLSKIFSEQSLGEAGGELKDLLHADVEDQMALLAFEVLEKTESLEVMEAKEMKHEGEVKQAREEETEKVNQLKEAIAVFHRWVGWRDRLAFLDGVRAWPRKQLLQGIGVVALILIVSVGFLRLTTGKKRIMEELQGKLAVAEENITQAATRGTFDKEEAALLLDEAKALAIEVLDSDYLGSEAAQLLDDIEEQKDFLDNVVRVDDQLRLLADFETVLGASSIRGVVPYQDKQVVYTDHEVYEVLLGEIQDPITIDGSQNIVSAAYFADQDNVVMLLDAGNMVEYQDQNAQFADTSDVEWAKGVELTTYSNKVYILDQEESQIWRYQRGTSAYGSAQAYVSGEDETLSTALSFAVDGNIWVLASNGDIEKYFAGESEPFFINEAPLKSTEGATKLFTELESNFLYLLDPADQRILVYVKSANTGDLTYETQYVFDSLKGTLQDFYLDKDRGVIILVTDQALYELSF